MRAAQLGHNREACTFVSVNTPDDEDAWAGTCDVEDVDRPVLHRMSNQNGNR
jgi:hypothetical protein